MDRRIVTAGLVAAFAASAAIAQSPTGPTTVSPIPVNPAPAESLSTSGNAGSTATPEQRQQRTQQGGNPADTTTPRRQGQEASDGRGQGAVQGQQAQQRAAAPQGQRAAQSPADIRYIQETMAAGTVTLQAANFAESKAQHPRVQRFAAFEREEQNMMFEILHALAEPATTSSTNAQATQATTSSRPQNASQAAATAPVLTDQASSLMEKMSRAERGPAFDREFVELQLARHQELLQVQERYLAGNPQNRELVNIAKLARAQIREHVTELQAIQKDLR
ncbi:MAG TPA: DUF4142 domain-containing protein [Microvirga sp.]|jgi:predicted outer membrane protein